MTVSLTPQTKDSLAADAGRWASQAAELRIVDAESCVTASHFLRGIKGLRLEIQKWFEPHVEAAMETKRKAEAARKALTDERDRMEAPLANAEAIVKRALLAWEQEQERLRLAEEARLQEEARKEAEARTLAAAAELEREATATGNAEMLQEAHDIIEQPIETPVVAVKTFVPKVHGVTYRDHWRVHESIDIKALAAAVASGAVASNLLTPNMTALNQIAKATQGTQQIPGVKFYNDRQIAARG
jgi:hypothetical protein